VPGTDQDFRRLRRIDGAVLDAAYTDLARDADGLARVQLSIPDRFDITLWVDQLWSFVQVFTGDTMPEPERRRSVAIEPMTCAPNAFNTGDGLRMLAPAETLAGSWGIQVRPG
jgi:aldose 1-epimerase